MGLPSKNKKQNQAKNQAKEKVTEANEAAAGMTEEVVEEVTEEIQEEPKAAAVPATTTQGGALSTKAGRIVMPFDAMEHALPVFQFGTLATIKAAQGNLVHPEDGAIGTKALIKPVSWHFYWTIAPNTSGAPASLCKYSDDGVILNDGSGVTVAEHLQFLKDNDHEKASSKQYISVYAMLEDCEKECEDIGQLVQLQLAPQSVLRWNKLNLSALTGQIDVAGKTVRVTAKPESFSGNDFTLMKFQFADKL